MHYTDLTAGDCLFPNFEIVETKYPGNRYVYIDELLNDWFFESQLKLFMFFQDLDENSDDILVINGSINSVGEA